MPPSSKNQEIHQPFRLGNHTIHPDILEIETNGKTVRVKPKSMAVLLCLAESPGRVCSRSRIFERVWGGAELSDEVLTQAVAELRRALGDSSRHSRVIQTVPRKGYRLVQSAGTVDRPSGGAGRAADRVQNLLPYPGLNRGSALVGRHPELTLLVKLLQQAACGQNGLVLIGGEPGIGKTRLAQEILNIAADEEHLAFFGRCSEKQTSAQYLPFAEIVEQCLRLLPQVTIRGLLAESAPDIARVFPELRRVFPDLPPPVELPPEQQQRYFFNLFTEFFRNFTERQPLCLLIDDLQWADEPTLSLLRHLIANIGDARLLVMGTFRDAGIDQSPPFAPFLEDMITHRLTQRIALRPLTETSVNEMLESLSKRPVPSAWSTAIYDRTDGNPFFVEEMFQHLREEGRALDRHGVWRPQVTLDESPLPDSVRWVLDRRLRRHGNEVVETLQTAAIIGRSFPVRLLRELVDAEKSLLTEVIDDAERAQLILPCEDRDDSTVGLRYQFAHDLIRHALLGQLSAVRRQQLHRRVARELERAYGDHLSEHAADIAFHLSESDEPDVARRVRFWTLAARSALEKAAGTEALGFAESALTHVPADDHKSRADLCYLRSEALRSVNRWEEAVPSFHEALTEYQAAGHGEGLARCCIQLGGIACWFGDTAAASAVLKLGLNALDGSSNPSLVELYCIQAMADSMNEDFESAKTGLDRARHIAEPIGVAQIIGPLEMSYGVVDSFAARIGKAVAHLDIANERLREARDLWNLALSLGTTQSCRVTLGEWQAAEDMDSEFKQIIDQTGHAGAQVWNWRANALIHLARHGDVATFKKAEGLGRALSKQAVPGLRHGTALAFAQAAYLQKRIDEALTWCDKAAQDEPYAWHGTAWAMTLKLSAYRGNAEPLEKFDENTSDFLADCSRWSWRTVKLIADLTEGLAFLDRLDRLTPKYGLLRQSLEATGARFVPGFPQLLERILGILAAGSERWDDAEYHFEAALEQTEKLPHVIEHAESLSWYAWMLERRGATGDKPKSSQLAQRAQREYSNLGLQGPGSGLARAAS